MKAAPESIDGAHGICYTPIDERHRFTGACKHIVRGQLQGAMSGLAIARYANQSGFYLFSCDANWPTVNDSYHDTLEDAKRQAEFEYTGVTQTWIKTI